MTIASVVTSFFFSNACILSTIFYNSLVLVMVGPVVIPCACAFTFVASRIRSRSRKVDAAECILKKKHLSVVVFILIFLHYYVSFTIFHTYACDSLDNGKAYLHADYSITCYTETYTARQLDGLTLPSRHSGLLHVVTVAQSGRDKKSNKCRTWIHPVFNGPRIGRRDITTRSRRIVLTQAFFFCWFYRTLPNRLPSCCCTRK